MTNQGGSITSGVVSEERPDPGPEPGEGFDHPVMERICRFGFGALAVGICLQALAAAIALAVVVGMIVLAITGGSGTWALVVSGAVVFSGCVAAAVCRLRARYSARRLAESGS